MHARSVGVEDTRDLDTQVVLPSIIEEQRFRAAFAFIVAGARSDRINVAPIVFGLRMNAWIAINLRSRRLQDLCPHTLGKPEHVDGAMHAGFGRLYRIALVVNWRCRAGKIVDLVDFDIEREGHVVAHQFKALVIEQMLDIAPRAAEEVVEQITFAPSAKASDRKGASLKIRIRL